MRHTRAVPLNETLYMEEIRFWLRSMKEHAKFVEAGLSYEDRTLRETAVSFAANFEELGRRAELLKNVKQSGGFIAEARQASQDFDRFQRSLLEARLTGKVGGSHFPFFLDHLIREGKCFAELLDRMEGGETALKTGSHTKEIVVWLRLMSDHTKLLRHNLDPSERRFCKIASEYAELFDHLVLEGRDLASMLYGCGGRVRAFHRFLLDVRHDVQRLRDFKRLAEELIGDNRLVGIMTADLAAHMKREAEHCLLMVALMEKEIIKHNPEAFSDDIESEGWTEFEREEAVSAQREENAVVVEAMPEEVEPIEPADVFRTQSEPFGAPEEEAPIKSVQEAEILPLPVLSVPVKIEPAAEISTQAATDCAPKEPIVQPKEESEAEKAPAPAESLLVLESPAETRRDGMVLARAGATRKSPVQSAGRAPGARLAPGCGNRPAMPRPLGKKSK